MLTGYDKNEEDLYKYEQPLACWELAIYVDSWKRLTNACFVPYYVIERYHLITKDE